jgi:hypothetical protein
VVPFVLFPPVEIRQALSSWLNHLALPPLWLDWQPFRKINKYRALYVFLLHFLAAVELIYADRSVDFWCFTYSVSICQYVFPCCSNTYSSTRCLIRRKLHLHESSQVVLSF